MSDQNPQRPALHPLGPFAYLATDRRQHNGSNGGNRAQAYASTVDGMVAAGVQWGAHLQEFGHGTSSNTSHQSADRSGEADDMPTASEFDTIRQNLTAFCRSENLKRQQATQEVQGTITNNQSTGTSASFLSPPPPATSNKEDENHPPVPFGKSGVLSPAPPHQSVLGSSLVAPSPIVEGSVGDLYSFGLNNSGLGMPQPPSARNSNEERGLPSPPKSERPSAVLPASATGGNHHEQEQLKKNPFGTSPPPVFSPTVKEVQQQMYAASPISSGSVPNTPAGQSSAMGRGPLPQVQGATTPSSGGHQRSPVPSNINNAGGNGEGNSSRLPSEPWKTPSVHKDSPIAVAHETPSLAAAPVPPPSNTKAQRQHKIPVLNQQDEGEKLDTRKSLGPGLSAPPEELDRADLVSTKEVSPASTAGTFSSRNNNEGESGGESDAIPAASPVATTVGWPTPQSTLQTPVMNTGIPMVGDAPPPPGGLHNLSAAAFANLDLPPPATFSDFVAEQQQGPQHQVAERPQQQQQHQLLHIPQGAQSITINTKGLVPAPLKHPKARKDLRAASDMEMIPSSTNYFRPSGERSTQGSGRSSQRDQQLAEELVQDHANTLEMPDLSDSEDERGNLMSLQTTVEVGPVPFEDDEEAEEMEVVVPNGRHSGSSPPLPKSGNVAVAATPNVPPPPPPTPQQEVGPFVAASPMHPIPFARLDAPSPVVGQKRISERQAAAHTAPSIEGRGVSSSLAMSQVGGGTSLLLIPNTPPPSGTGALATRKKNVVAAPQEVDPVVEDDEAPATKRPRLETSSTTPAKGSVPSFMAGTQASARKTRGESATPPPAEGAGAPGPTASNRAKKATKSTTATTTKTSHKPKAAGASTTPAVATRLYDQRRRHGEEWTPAPKPGTGTLGVEVSQFVQPSFRVEAPPKVGLEAEKAKKSKSRSVSPQAGSLGFSPAPGTTAKHFKK